MDVARLCITGPMARVAATPLQRRAQANAPVAQYWLLSVSGRQHATGHYFPFPHIRLEVGLLPRLRLVVLGSAEAAHWELGRETQLSHFGLSTTRLVTDNITSDDAVSCDKTRCFRNYATPQFQQIGYTDIL